MSRGRRIFLITAVALAGLFGRIANAHDTHTVAAGTTGGSNSNGGNSSSNKSGANTNGSSNSSSNRNGSGSSNGSSNSSSNHNGNGGTGGTTGGGGTGATTGATTGGGGTATTNRSGTGATNPTVASGPVTTIAPSRVAPASESSCPKDTAGAGVHCYRITPNGNSQGARLPDGRVVVLPPGPTINVDTGASTSNDTHQVIVVNNDNRVIDRTGVGRALRQWILATVGLLMLVLVAAAGGAFIFRAGMRQGRAKGDG